MLSVNGIFGRKRGLNDKISQSLHGFDFKKLFGEEGSNERHYDNNGIE
jgi:hypothetical protein